MLISGHWLDFLGASKREGRLEAGVPSQEVTVPTHQQEER